MVRLVVVLCLLTSCGRNAERSLTGERGMIADRESATTSDTGGELNLIGSVPSSSVPELTIADLLGVKTTVDGHANVGPGFPIGVSGRYPIPGYTTPDSEVHGCRVTAVLGSLGGSAPYVDSNSLFAGRNGRTMEKGRQQLSGCVPQPLASLPSDVYNLSHVMDSNVDRYREARVNAHFIVHDSGLAPLRDVRVVPVGQRTPSGSQVFDVTWMPPSLPPAARVIATHILVSTFANQPHGFPYDPTQHVHRVMDTRADYIPGGSSRSVKVELPVGLNRVTVAYRVRFDDLNHAPPNRNSVRYEFAEYHLALVRGQYTYQFKRVTPQGAPVFSAVSVSPGVSTEVLVEDDVFFDREYYGRALGHIPPDRLYDHYMRHGVQEGRVPSFLLGATLRPKAVSVRTANFAEFTLDSSRVRPELLAGARYLATFDDRTFPSTEDLVVFDDRMRRSLDFHTVHPDFPDARSNGWTSVASQSHLRYFLRVFLGLTPGKDRFPGSVVFNPDLYLVLHPDVAAGVARSATPRIAAAKHFVEHGMAERRLASEFYNEGRYRMIHTDVDQAVKSGAFNYAGRHYLEYGQWEDRDGGVGLNFQGGNRRDKSDPMRTPSNVGSAASALVLSPEAFVRKLFSKYLERAPRTDEFVFHTMRLANRSMTREALDLEFANCAEAVALRARRQR